MINSTIVDKRISGAFVFMKVGNHAGETFEQILERKNGERRQAGRIFWGYGGTACHPLTQVQPFVRTQAKKIGSMFLCMELIDSKADPEVVPATEYSDDGIIWKPIPDGIRVTGSRYALVLDEIHPGDLAFNPEVYRVGVGPSRGKSADEYIRGHVDKACLIKASKDTPMSSSPRRISYSARLLAPYAVILR